MARRWELGTFDPWRFIDLNITVEDALRRYKREKGKTIETARDSIWTVNNLAEHAGARFITELSPQSITDFVYRPHLAEATKYSYFKKLNAVFNWFTEKGFFRDNPLLEVPKPKKPETLPKYYSEEQLDRLLIGAEAYYKLNSRLVFSSYSTRYGIEMLSN